LIKREEIEDYEVFYMNDIKPKNKHSQINNQTKTTIGDNQGELLVIGALLEYLKTANENKRSSRNISQNSLITKISDKYKGRIGGLSESTLTKTFADANKIFKDYNNVP
jgi:hypothetical protein